MNSKGLLVASSVTLGAAGLAASFAPAELLRALGSPSNGTATVIAQLIGALYLAFALTNWTAKDNAIGGIYSRPIALGNMLHFVMGALSLVKWEMTHARNSALAGVTVVYAIFAVLFARLFFGQGPMTKR